MNMKDIVIDNCCIGRWSEDLDYDSGFHPDEAILCFEGLVNRPCTVLIGKYGLDTKMKYLNFILPHVAKAFNTDRNKLREQWTSSVGYYECFKEE